MAASYNESQRKALAEWNEAQRAYKAECSLFQRMRRKLPKKAELTTMEDIYACALLRQRLSEASKEYENARYKFNAAMRPLAIDSQLSEILQKIKDAISGIDSGDIATGKVEVEFERARERYKNDPQVQKLKELLLKQQENMTAEPLPSTIYTEGISKMALELDSEPELDLDTDNSTQFTGEMRQIAESLQFKSSDLKKEDKDK